MPDVLSAVLLGVIQGLTEFLPVSSTAHLILVPWLLGWSSPLLTSLTFDVALHMGTLLAVLMYFRREWVRLAVGFLGSLRTRSLADPWARLSWLVIVGTIPAVIVGVLLEKKVESIFRSPLLIAVMLGLFSLVIVLAERHGRGSRGIEALGWRDAIAIGLGQAVAVIPGVSRSGATISTGLVLGVERAAAARFSFLLATPVIGGAGAKKLIPLLGQPMPSDEVGLMLVGAAAAGIVGWLCIHWFLAYLGRHSLYVFIWYRIAAALVVVGVYVARGG